MQPNSLPLLCIICYTIGYGGRRPMDFVRLLTDRRIKTLVDVRLKPDRANMGCYKKAKTPDKGIERLLAEVGISYLSLPDLGNPFLTDEDWEDKYRLHLQQQGASLLHGLEVAERPFCLMCAEKKVVHCHRQFLADLLVSQGWTVVHIQ